MADDIKVFNAADLVKGVKLTFHGQGHDETPEPHDALKGSAHAPGPPRLGPAPRLPSIAVPSSHTGAAHEPTGSLLEGIAASLTEQYQASEWLVPPGQPNDWRFMLAVCRAALVAWFNPAATLPDRLRVVEAVGRAFGLDENALEQVVAESLVTNAQVPRQLQQQHLALSNNVFAVRPDSFAPEQEGKLAYQAFRRDAMVEAEHLLQQQLGLPEFNGLLQVEVVGATGLRTKKAKGSSHMLPYAAVWLSDKSGTRRSDKQYTKVATDRERPVWIQPLTALPVANPDMELVVQVRSANDRNRPSRLDPLLGRVAMRLAGLTSGLTQQVDLQLYGRREAKGGAGGGGGGGFLCGCFGGGREERTPTEVETEVAGRAASVEQLDDLEGGRVVFDPSTSMTTGVNDRQTAGRLTLMLRYLPERRERIKRPAKPQGSNLAGAHPNNRHNRTQSAPEGPQSHSTKADLMNTAPGDAMEAAAASLPGLSKLLRSQLAALHAPMPPSMRLMRRLDSRDVDPLAVMDPGIDFHTTFRKLSAALQSLAADRAAGATALAAVPDPGIPLTALGALGQAIEDRHLEAPLARVLPRALGPTGLQLLLLFAKLYRVRTATQQLALLQALLSEGAWDPASPAYLGLLKRLWQPVLRENSSGLLTVVETEGLSGVSAAFLRRACPLLGNHYEELPGEEAVPCLVLIIEMAGWAVTGDPRGRTASTANTPTRGTAAAAAAGGANGGVAAPSAASLHLLIDHMQRAAVKQAADTAALRPTHDSLPAYVQALTKEAERSAEQMEQDLRLQAEIPGLRPLTRTNCRIRYDALSDALETLFMYRPGSNKAAATALWPLEVAVTQLHTLMLRNHLARQPHASACKSPSRRRHSGGDGSSEVATASPRSGGGGGGWNRGGRKAYDQYGDDDDSDVSPVSVGSGSRRAGRGTSQPLRRRSDGSGGTDPRVGSGSGAGRWRSDADEDEDKGEGGGGGDPRVLLFDFEGAMVEAMAEWAELGGEDLKRQLNRLLERDPLWPPPLTAHEAHGTAPAAGGGGGAPSSTHAGTHGLAEARAGPGAPSAAAGGGGPGGGGGGGGRGLVCKAVLSSGAGESAMELFRMLQVYLDVSVERALGGGDQRPALMGPPICAAVLSCIRIYLHHCMRAWEEIIICRALPAEAHHGAAAGGGGGGHRHARTISDRFLYAIGLTGGAPSAAAPAPHSSTISAASAAGGILGSFAVSLAAAGPIHGHLYGHTHAHAHAHDHAHPSIHAPNSGLVPAADRSCAAAVAAAGGKPHAAPVMPEFGVMTPGPGGGPAGSGASQMDPAHKRRHRRAATATDADSLLGGSHHGPTGRGPNHLPPLAPVPSGRTNLPATGATGGSQLPPSAMLALASAPGLVACEPLVMVRNTIAAVAEGAEALEDTLGLLAPRPPLVTSKVAAAQQQQQQLAPASRGVPGDVGKQAQKGSSARGVAAPSAPPPPAFLTRTITELRHALALSADQCLISYHLMLRQSLLRGLLAAFDPAGARPVSRTALEGLLSALHEELLCVSKGVRQAAVAGAMVAAAWHSAVRCVWAMALHQAGFRPITEEEADVLREFLISLQDMFGEVVSEHLVPRDNPAARAAAGRLSSTTAAFTAFTGIRAAASAGASGGGGGQSAGGGAEGAPLPGLIPPVLINADSRAAGTAYPSALLQCVAASTQDLKDMYMAQVSCMQKLDEPVGDEEVTLYGHQVTLLDLLRLLRQRRRTDTAANTFVTEQLRLAASNVMQALFGLRASERLIATATCCLTPPVGAIGPSAVGGGGGGSVQLGAVHGAHHQGGIGGGVAGVSSSREGCLYVTPRALGFSTMLSGDLKGITDVTNHVKLKTIREVAKGEGADALMFLTQTGDIYHFYGFAPGERDRICSLINGNPTVARAPHLAAPSAAGGGPGSTGASRPDSPRRTGGGYTPAAGAGSAGGLTPSGTATPPQGMAKPASQPSNLAAALLSAVTSTLAAPASSASAPGPAAQAGRATPAGTAAAATVAGGSGGPLSRLSAGLKGAAAAQAGGAGAAGGAAAAAATAAAPPPPAQSRPGESGSLPLLSAPCHLVNVLRNKDGMLNLYVNRLEFVCATDPGVSRSMLLADINNVSQRPAGWGGGSVLVLSLEGDKAPVVFGGIGDALLATLKQNISELCFANG